MLKQRILTVLAELTLLMTIAGAGGVVADTLGLVVTPQAHACQNSGSSGGGC